MARIRSRDTKPEVAVRRVLYSMGIRYRLHERRLPGSPDIVMRGRRKVIFVHGCFWHRHPGCQYAYDPKSRKEFWSRKFMQNVARDQEVICQLSSEGWDVLIVWECETRDEAVLRDRLRLFLQ